MLLYGVCWRPNQQLGGSDVPGTILSPGDERVAISVARDPSWAVHVFNEHVVILLITVMSVKI